MIYKMLLTNTGFIAGVVIEGVLAIAAIVLMILVLKKGLPQFEKKERESKVKREKEAPATYALRYVAGEASGEQPGIEFYRRGERVTVKLNMFATPEGKQFYGWSDGSKRYAPQSKFAMPNQDVTLTAQWEEIPKREEAVRYGLAYVSGGANGEAPAVERYVKGEKVRIKSNMFATPTGKRFSGWYDGVKRYEAGEAFTMPEQSVTLTAQWEEIEKKEEAKVEEPKVEQAKVPTVEVKAEGDKAEQVIDGGTTPDGRPIIVNVYNTHGSSEKSVEKEIIRTVEKEEEDDDDDGLEFADYTILQLYELMSEEQKRYFDKLKDAAMSKPQAKLSVGKKYFNIKIGKRSILKLKIKRLITVGEFSLENDILRDFRKASENKAGNSKIKVRPTVVAVTDEATLETALNMIDLVHKQILES